MLLLISEDLIYKKVLEAIQLHYHLKIQDSAARVLDHRKHYQMDSHDAIPHLFRRFLSIVFDIHDFAHFSTSSDR
jgi:hypothetical protein